MNNYLILPYSILALADINLTSRVLLAEIISLSKKEGYCFASNEFFSERLGISKRTAANSINELREKNYIISRRKRYIRYIELNREKLYSADIPPIFTDEIFSAKDANLADKSENISDSSAKTAQYNNNYNNKYKNNYKENKRTSYDIEELMKIL